MNLVLYENAKTVQLSSEPNDAFLKKQTFQKIQHFYEKKSRSDLIIINTKLYF
jgi:hypothetical protein